MDKVVTICMHCKCVKAHDNTWFSNMKIKIKDNDDCDYISHGLCDDCFNKHYPKQNKKCLLKQ